MRYAGKIGFADEADETSASIYEETFTERTYRGDVLSSSRRLDASSDGNNPNITLTNRISVVADPFACAHYFAMRYIMFEGHKWEIKTVEVQLPRIIITLGGLFNK